MSGGSDRWRAIVVLAVAATIACEEATQDTTADGVPPPAPHPTEVARDEPVRRAPPLACDDPDFPCVWSEVSSEVVERTDALAREGLARLGKGALPGEVALWLASHDRVAAVTTDGKLVRFRLAGGRPVWITEVGEELLGTRSLASPADAQTQPPASPTGPDDPIGENPPGRRPWKKALVLAPFQWEFGEKEVDDLRRHLGVAGAEDRDPFAVRDYRCGEAGGCVVIQVNDVVNPDPDSGECWEKPGGCPMAYGVDLSAFKSWREHDLIHVATHGFHLCGTNDPETVRQWAEGSSVEGSRDLAGTSAKLASGGCVTALATGRVYPAGSLQVGQVGDPGVEYLYAGMGNYCQGAPSGSIRWIQQYCGGPDVLLELVADDFFTAAYGGALTDKLIFLNACSGLADRGLAQALTSGDAFVLGWTDPVPKGAATVASDLFYEAYLDRNLTAVDAWYETASSEKLSDYSAGLLDIDQGWRSILPEELAEQLLGETELESTGADQRRGREMVSVRRPGSDEEIEDGSLLPSRGYGDGECAPELGLVLEGMSARDDPASIPLRVSMNGADLEQTFSASRPAGPGRFRFDGPVPPPPGVDPESPFDLEIWAELPGGGKSRWRYEDLQAACGCSFSANLSGHTRKGTVQGEWAVFSTRGQVGLMGGMGSRPTAETTEDLLNAMKMAQGLQGFLGGQGGPEAEAAQEQLMRLLEGQLEEQREAGGSSGGTLSLSLVESGPGHPGPDPSGGVGTAFKLDAFSEQAIEPGFTGDVPLDMLAFHTGEFASEGLAPTLYRWDRETAGSATLTVREYDGQWLEGTVTADLPAIPGLMKLDGGKPWVRVSADFVAGLFNPLRMENACLMATAFGE